MGALVRFAIALSTLVGTLAAPTTKSTADLPDFELGSGKLAPRQDYTYNWTGIDNHVNFQPTSNGYSVTFSYASTDPSTVSEFFVGRGWSRGANRNITFSGSTAASNAGTVSVSIYGWSTNPLVEYWIREYSNRNAPPQGQMVGSFESDGSTYDIWKHPQVSLPTVGTEVYWQYYSVRRDMRSSGGTVTTANHFAAWAKNGMKLGTMDYQILATEGYKAVGSSNYTVSG